MSFAQELLEARERPEEPPRLPDRLQDYARYVALVAEQLEALRQHDLPRLRRLSEERAKLEAELRERPEPEAEADLPGEDGVPLSEELQALLRDGLSALLSHSDLDRSVREECERLQSGALRMARGMRLRPARAGRYGDLGPADARVDVRL